jgi:hypothetical protein
MTLDPSRFQIVQLIAHGIPSVYSTSGVSKPELTDVPIEFTTKEANRLQERVSRSLSQAPYCIEFDPKSPSVVPSLVTEMLAGKTANFTGDTQSMARRLFEIQPRMSSEGLLLVATGKYKDQIAVVILKLDKEEGFRAERTQFDDGRTTYRVEVISDLLLTKSTRVFKTAMFVPDLVGSIKPRGIVSDNQARVRSATPVAKFFLHEFLGCRFCDDPANMTKLFLELTQSFINDQVDDPVQQYGYYSALVANLLSNDHSVRIEEFAQSHLSPAHEQQYLNVIEESELTALVFEKNLELIEGQVRRKQMDLDNGVSVSGRAEDFDRFVDVDRLDGDIVQVRTSGRVKSFRLKSR